MKNCHPITRARKLTRTAMLVAFLAVAGSLGLTAAAPAAAAPFCGITWGSLPKSGVGSGADDVLAVRAGQHSCFDRLVVDLAHGSSSYSVEYVPSVFGDPSGSPIPLAGGARLRIVLRDMVFANGSGSVSHPLPMPNVAGYRTFRQVALAGSFEGVTSFGLGVRARLPFRTFILAGPGTGSRLVIDVAHLW